MSYQNIKMLKVLINSLNIKKIIETWINSTDDLIRVNLSVKNSAC